jgi:hypothetical protein
MTGTHLRRVAQAIGTAFTDGEWLPEPMAARAGRAIGDRRRAWLRELALIAVHAFPDPPRDAPRRLAELLLHTDLLRERARLDVEEGREPWTPRLLPTSTAMGPLRWPVPPLDTVADLAEHLGLHPLRLRWFADTRSWERTVTAEALRHYTYRWIAKRSAGARLIEAPKPMLRLFQRRVLHEILGAVPPHTAAHGFRPGRSVHTFVAPHVGRDVVVRLDLESFFASVTAGRVHGIFRAAGYPEPVAVLLTGLVTNAAPRAVGTASPAGSADRAAHRRLLGHLAHPHLPQGAPTSPALANLAANGLDRRLTGLARSFGMAYTRYADDLAFSGRRFGDATRRAFLDRAESAVRDEGFRLNAAKVLVRGRHQRQRLGGLVVNDRPNVTRTEYDRLRAVLHDAARRGPDAANRAQVADFRGHLLGRISWVEAANPARGPKLHVLFGAITW